MSKTALYSDQQSLVCEGWLESFKEVFKFRELFYFFIWRDILVRYKQAFFGLTWALIRPILNMLFFTLVFGKIAHLPSDHVNYGLFVLAAMLPWQLFSSATVEAGNSLVNQAQLLSKVYFPRLLIPAAHIGVNLLDFAVTLVLFLILLPIYANYQWSLLATPFLILLTLMLCLGSGIWLAALTVRYRDFRIIVPFFMQFGMFISPVGYGSFLISDHLAWWYALNPLVGIIDGFRWAFFSHSHPFLLYNIIVSTFITSLLFLGGLFYFKKTEKLLADII